jgi:hypothetical protein
LICSDRQNPVGIAVVNETRLTAETRRQHNAEDRIFFRFISALQKRGALKMTPVVSEALRLKALPMNFPLKLSTANL